MSYFEFVGGQNSLQIQASEISAWMWEEWEQTSIGRERAAWLREQLEGKDRKDITVFLEDKWGGVRLPISYEQRGQSYHFFD